MLSTKQGDIVVYLVTDIDTVVVMQNAMKENYLLRKHTPTYSELVKDWNLCCDILSRTKEFNDNRKALAEKILWQRAQEEAVKKEKANAEKTAKAKAKAKVALDARKAKAKEKKLTDAAEQTKDVPAKHYLTNKILAKMYLLTRPEALSKMLQSITATSGKYEDVTVDPAIVTATNSKVRYVINYMEKTKTDSISKTPFTVNASNRDCALAFMLAKFM